MEKNRPFVIAALLCAVMTLSGCGKDEPFPAGPADIEGLVFSEREELSYADRFAIDRYEGGYSLISAADGGKYLFLPENGNAPAGLDGDVKVISRPVENIYLAATSAMSFFDVLDGIGSVGYSGTRADGWYIDAASAAMEKGDIVYAGKYNVPDYELLLSGGCVFSVQSTMIDHAPETKEKLEELGITVFTDMSSYEDHPLGRTEWIKVYGEMLGKQDLARELFEAQADIMTGIDPAESQGKTAVYFYINSSGQPVTRRSGDYISKMISLAGGKNVFEDLGSSGASSSVTMETEEFYASAVNADYIIYNGAVDGGVYTVDQLIDKSVILEDFKAVKEGNVWCARSDLFQETMKLGTAVSDLNRIFTDSTENSPPQFFYKLEKDG